VLSVIAAPKCYCLTRTFTTHFFDGHWLGAPSGRAISRNKAGHDSEMT
jgi:hypothetical protein